jgi:RNase H-fold protein (predicted Holliday junction resolvase)
MSYTKGELVHAALEEIGIAAYEFDISPEQVSAGIRRLDSMMAEWSIKGILVEFPISKEQNSDPSDNSNIPDWSWEAVITNLAVRIAPSYGKAVSMETKTSAQKAYRAVCAEYAKPRPSRFPSMPKGAGS